MCENAVPRVSACFSIGSDSGNKLGGGWGQHTRTPVGCLDPNAFILYSPRVLARYFSAVWLLGLALIAPVASGQHDARWFEQHWRRCGEWTPGATALVNYRVTIPAPEFARSHTARLESIEKLPNAADVLASNRPLLAEDERVVREGADFVAEYRLWIGPRRWRLSKDVPQRPSQAFGDFGFDGETTWRLGPTSLSLVERADETGAEANLLASSRRAVSWLFHGGIGEAWGLPNSPAPTSFEPDATDGWTATATSDSRGGWRWVSRGRMAPDGVPLTESLVIQPAQPSADTPATDVRFQDWRFDPLLKHWVAHRIEVRRTPDMRLREVWTVTSIEPITAGELAKVTRRPTWDGEDAIRGTLSIRNVSDYRPGARETLEIEDGAIVGRMSMTPLTSTSRLRRVGWWILAISGGAVAAFAIRNRRAVTRRLNPRT